MSAPVVCILGVDPGLMGAISFYCPDEPSLVAVEDMPVAGDDIDPATLASRLRQLQPTVAMIERVGSMPGQGLSSTFKFGKGYGTVIGTVIALGIPTHFVTPGKWKRHFRLDADKEQARALALQLWPGSSFRFERKKDAGRAEACLIARFAAETLGSHQVGTVARAA